MKGELIACRPLLSNTRAKRNRIGRLAKTHTRVSISSRKDHMAFNLPADAPSRMGVKIGSKVAFGYDVDYHKVFIVPFGSAAMSLLPEGTLLYKVRRQSAHTSYLKVHMPIGRQHATNFKYREGRPKETLSGGSKYEGGALVVQLPTDIEYIGS